jgi:hypothetical protein
MQPHVLKMKAQLYDMKASLSIVECFQEFALLLLLHPANLQRDGS